MSKKKGTTSEQDQARQDQVTGIKDTFGANLLSMKSVSTEQLRFLNRNSKSLMAILADEILSYARGNTYYVRPERKNRYAKFSSMIDRCNITSVWVETFRHLYERSYEFHLREMVLVKYNHDHSPEAVRELLKMRDLRPCTLPEMLFIGPPDGWKTFRIVCLDQDLIEHEPNEFPTIDSSLNGSDELQRFLMKEKHLAHLQFPWFAATRADVPEARQLIESQRDQAKWYGPFNVARVLG